jgi:hypothetical protein
MRPPAIARNSRWLSNELNPGSGTIWILGTSYPRRYRPCPNLCTTDFTAYLLQTANLVVLNFSYPVP